MTTLEKKMKALASGREFPWKQIVALELMHQKLHLY